MTNENESRSAQAADDYISEQLEAAQGTLGRAKLVSVILIIMVLAYMSFVTKQVMKYLTPTAAAETASAVILKQISEHEPTITTRLKSYVPGMVENLTDTTLASVPAARERVEEDLRQNLDGYTQIAVWRITPQLDALLESHAEDFRTFAENPDDVERVRGALGDDIDALLAEALAATTTDGRTLADRIHAYAERLNRLADQTTHLANSEELTDAEQFTRRAIATLFATVEISNDPASEVTAPENGDL